MYKTFLGAKPMCTFIYFGVFFYTLITIKADNLENAHNCSIIILVYDVYGRARDGR